MFVLGISGFCFACTGNEDEGRRGEDPRCDLLCTPEEPMVEGAYDMCSGTSADSCVEVCLARIEGADNLCAECLLEGACFDTSCEEDVGFGDRCDGASGTCTMDGREGSCTYPYGDEAAREDCLRQVYPRREVDCSVEFEPVAPCASLCSEQ